MIALAACGGGGDDDGPGGSDGGPGDEVDAGGGECGALAAPAVPWLDDDLIDTVAALSGAAEIAPDLTISDRSSDVDRDAVRDYLVARLEALELTAQLQPYAGGANVWATVPGEGAGGALVLGAHFDTVPDCPGADDNATGVAVVLAAARYLTEVDCRQRDVIVAFFDEEEVGLVGSQEFAAQLIADAVDVAAVHTVDQLGWDADGDGVVELEKPGAGLAALYGDALEAAGYELTLSVTATPTSDHEAFRQVGMLATGVTEEYAGGDTTPHFHTPGDTIDTLDPGYFATAARLVLYTVARQARD